MKTLFGTTALAVLLTIGAPGLASAQTQGQGGTSGTATAQTQADNTGSGATGAKVGVQEPSPHVMVKEPQPNVTVKQPKPDVAVQQPKPHVVVRQPTPDVTVKEAKPQVTVHEAKPNVTVERTGKPNVNVQRTGTAQVKTTPSTSTSSHGTARAESNPGTAQNNASTGTAQPGQQAAKNNTAATQGVPLKSAQNIVGTKVTTANGKQSGQIHSLLVGAGDHVRAAVVQSGGGIFGIGQTQVVVPIQHIHFANGAKTAKLDLTKKQLLELPHYDKAKMHQYASRYGWGNDVRSYR